MRRSNDYTQRAAAAKQTMSFFTSLPRSQIMLREQKGKPFWKCKPNVLVWVREWSRLPAEPICSFATIYFFLCLFAFVQFLVHQAVFPVMLGTCIFCVGGDELSPAARSTDCTGTLQGRLQATSHYASRTVFKPSQREQPAYLPPPVPLSLSSPISLLYVSAVCPTRAVFLPSVSIQ